MFPISKFPAWKARPGSSVSSAQSTRTNMRARENLSLDAWPELPTSGSAKASSTKSTSRKAPEVGFQTPKKSPALETESSTGDGSPTPRARQTYSNVLHPRPNRSHSQSHDIKALLLLDSPTIQSKRSAPKPADSSPPKAQSKAKHKMPPGNQTSQQNSQPADLSALVSDLQSNQHSAFSYLYSIIQENDYLKRTVEVMAQQLELEREHLANTIRAYESLDAIGKAKQVVLFKRINQLNNGEDDSPSSVSEPVTCVEVTAENEGLAGSSRDNGRLDPNAEAFIPSATTSPAKPHDQYPFASFYQPESPQHYTQCAPEPESSAEPTTPATPTHASFSTPLLNAQTPPTPSVLDVIVRSIPPIFRTVCPFSLNGELCPLRACPMKKLCPRFNHQWGNSGCQARPGCRHLHERATCLADADPGGCTYAEERRGKGNGKGKTRESDAGSAHMKNMVHRDDVGMEEWRLRLVISGLRGPHTEGHYKNA